MNWRNSGGDSGGCADEMPAPLEDSMPVVQITMLQGRSTEQKRKIAKRITDALVEEAGARREGIIVAFNEVSKENYASGGELMIDKGK
jgi:4-oxalocrotonate tautomerase